MEKRERNEALWDLFVKTGLPEAYSLYKSEERSIDGRSEDAGNMPSRGRLQGE